MTMQHIIAVEKRNKYGTDYFYPVNEQAENACETVAGSKKKQTSLSAENLKRLKAMGFNIQVMAKVGAGYVKLEDL